jgi:tRNA(Phe) wybutosine-synthesizing methylase Tyw3
MKKTILSIILLAIIGITAGVYYVYSNIDILVKTAIETYGSEATQTAVGVDQVKIDLTNGAAEFSGLSIANPKGFDFPNVFLMGEIRAGVDLKSLQEEPYVINEITVFAPQVFVEVNEENKNNLNELKDRLMSGTSSSSKSEQSGSTDKSSSPGPRLIVRRVTFADGSIQARIAALENKEFILKLPSLDMKNLGGSQGATGEELAREIIQRLTDHAIKEVKSKIIDKELAKLKASAQDKVDEEEAKLKAQVDEVKQEQKQKAEDKLKNLLGK